MTLSLLGPRQAGQKYHTLIAHSHGSKANPARYSIPQTQRVSVSGLQPGLTESGANKCSLSGAYLFCSAFEPVQRPTSPHRSSRLVGARAERCQTSCQASPRSAVMHQTLLGQGTGTERQRRNLHQYATQACRRRGHASTPRLLYAQSPLVCRKCCALRNRWLTTGVRREPPGDWSGSCYYHHHGASRGFARPVPGITVSKTWCYRVARDPQERHR